MNNLEIDTDTRITLYVKECYGCDRHNKFGPIRQFVLDHHIKLGNYIVKRIELNPEWQEEARQLEMELPAIVFETEGQGREAMTYAEFVKQLSTQSQNEKSAKPARRAGSRVGGESSLAAPSLGLQPHEEGEKVDVDDA